MSIKYVAESERSVFLHFLNREAFRACGGTPDTSRARRILEILTTTHCSKMVVNISQFVEFAGNDIGLLEEVFVLNDFGIVAMISQSTTAMEFICSRRELYKHDQARYPMYFTENSLLSERFSIGVVNKVSTTKVLQNEIRDWDGGAFIGPGYEVLSEADRLLILPKVELIKDVTITNRERAVTRALYQQHDNGHAFNANELAAIARLVSGMYIKNYRAKGPHALCSGIDGIAYYEDTKNFPFYDVKLLETLLDAIGYGTLTQGYSLSLREERVQLFDTAVHARFVGVFNVLLACMAKSLSDSDFSNDVTAPRSRIQSMIRQAASDVVIIPRSFHDLRHFYEYGYSQIERMAHHIGERNDAFAKQWSDYMGNTEKPSYKTLLLLTATEAEDKELYRQLELTGVKVGKPERIGEGIAFPFEAKLPLNIYHVRSGAGSSGTNGSAAVTVEAWSHLKPDFVISVGICFGTDKTKQKIGDILIAKEINHYEPGRISQGVFTPRGQTPPASDFLLTLCNLVNVDGFKKILGTVASGDKLVDNRYFVDYLRSRPEEVIGGEMEGTGISSICARNGVRWILIKSICDWGYNKNKKHQPLAAENAAKFVAQLVQRMADVSNV